MCVFCSTIVRDSQGSQSKATLSIIWRIKLQELINFWQTRTNRVTGSRAENSTTSKPVVCLKLFSHLKGLVKFQSYYSKNTSWSSHSTSQDTLKIFFVHISKLVFDFLLFYYLLLFHLVQITSSRDMKQSRACNSQGCVGFKTNTPKISYWIRGFAHNEVFMYKSTCT